MNDQRKPIQLGIFDVMSNWLYAQPVQGSTRRPNLRIKVMGNVPRITVKTNVDNDKNYGKIDFQTDMQTFAVFVHKLNAMAEGTDQSEGYMFDYVDDFLNGKKLDAPIVISTLRVGRDKETGRIYIAILSGDKSRPRIQFFFGPSKYHNIRNADGSALSAKEMSESYAIGFIKPASELVYTYLVKNFDEDAKNVPKPQGAPGGNQGGGGNYNRGGQQGGGYQQRPNGGGGQAPGGFDDSFSADIPNF